MKRSLTILLLCGLVFAGYLLSVDDILAAAQEPSHLQSRIEISSPPKARLSGAVGTYPIEPIKIRVFAGKGNYQLQLTVTPLSYHDGRERGHFELDTVYWIDHEHQQLTPGMPYLVPIANSALRKGENRCVEMVLYGRVTIHQISAQPAGEYTGKVTVTVTRLP